MNTEKIKKNCLHCQQAYLASKEFSKFCKVNCRVLFNKKFGKHKKKTMASYFDATRHLSAQLDQLIENVASDDALVTGVATAINEFLKTVKTVKEKSTESFHKQLKEKYDGEAKS